MFVSLFKMTDHKSEIRFQLSLEEDREHHDADLTHTLSLPLRDLQFGFVDFPYIFSLNFKQFFQLKKPNNLKMSVS